MNLKNVVLSLASVVLLAGCNATRAPVVVVTPAPQVALESAPLRWNIPSPVDKPLVMRGVVNMDDAGLDGGGPLYPGGNAATFLAAVFTHAAIADAAHEKQKAELQERADKVLTPYLPLLATLQYGDILDAAISQMSVEGEKVLIDSPDMLGNGWLATIEPTFQMTQDERAVLMEGVVTLFSPEDRDAPYYRNLIRVVSLPVQSEDPATHWMGTDNERMREELAALIADGLDAAIEHATLGRAAAEETQRTFRYMEGAVERVERAQLLDQMCKRMLLKTLRGHLYLVPMSDQHALETSRLASCEPNHLDNDLAG